MSPQWSPGEPVDAAEAAVAQDAAQVVEEEAPTVAAKVEAVVVEVEKTLAEKAKDLIGWTVQHGKAFHL